MRRRFVWVLPAACLLAVAWLAVVLAAYPRVESLAPLLSVGRTVAWLLLLTVACLGAGRPIWRAARLDEITGAEPLTVVLAAGAGVLVAGAALASLVGALIPSVLIALLAVAAAVGTHWVWTLRVRVRPRVATGLLTPVALLALAALATLPVLGLLSPFYDQFNYHLAFPYQWLRRGCAFVYPRHSYSYLTANMGFLYAYGMSAGGPWTGQAVSWWTGALAAMGTWALGRRLAGPRGGAWAAAIFVATPAVLVPSTWAGADLGVAAFAVAGWLLLLRLRDRRGRHAPVAWLAAGAMAGLAAGCKYLALAMVSVPMAAVLLVVVRPLARGERMRCAGLWVAGAALAFAPWLARNVLLTGNPVFPFFNSLLPPHTLLAAQGPEEVRAAAMVATFPADRMAPADRLLLGTLNPQGAVGAIGPVFLGLAPLAAWATLRKRRRGGGILAAGAVLGVAGWWFAPQLGRYLAPVLALLAVLLAAGLVTLRGRCAAPLRAVVSAALAVALLWNLAASFGHSLPRLLTLLGATSEEQVMREQVSYWPAIRFVNRQLPVDAKVLLVAESRTLLLDRELEVEDPFRRPLLVQLADSTGDPVKIAQALRERGVTHVLYNRDETARIAAMLRRERYFEPASEAGAVALRQFLEQHLRSVFAEGDATVYELR